MFGYPSRRLYARYRCCQKGQSSPGRPDSGEVPGPVDLCGSERVPQAIGVVSCNPVSVVRFVRYVSKISRPTDVTPGFLHPKLFPNHELGLRLRMIQSGFTFDEGPQEQLVRVGSEEAGGLVQANRGHVPQIHAQQE